MKRIFRKPSKPTGATNIFGKLGEVIEKRHLVFLILGLVLIVPTIIAATQLEMKTGFDTYVSSDSQVYKDMEKFQQYFSADTIVIMITAEDLNQLLQPANMAAMPGIRPSTPSAWNALAWRAACSTTAEDGSGVT